MDTIISQLRQILRCRILQDELRERVGLVEGSECNEEWSTDWEDAWSEIDYEALHADWTRHAAMGWDHLKLMYPGVQPTESVLKEVAKAMAFVR